MSNGREGEEGLLEIQNTGVLGVLSFLGEGGLFCWFFVLVCFFKIKNNRKGDEGS